jgi:hypothetical protein
LRVISTQGEGMLNLWTFTFFDGQNEPVNKAICVPFCELLKNQLEFISDEVQ